MVITNNRIIPETMPVIMTVAIIKASVLPTCNNYRDIESTGVIGPIIKHIEVYNLPWVLSTSLLLHDHSPFVLPILANTGWKILA